jgi:hypothetical protein
MCYNLHFPKSKHGLNLRDKMTHSHQRIQKYLDVSTKIGCLSNEKLTQILDDEKPMHKSTWGKSALIDINGTPVFIKKVPLTDLELQPKNFMSTVNVFNLPMYYQYGVGSAGFGAWRELAAHIMTTNWVIANECANFPILYHWRVLPNCPSDMNLEEWKGIEEYSQYWENVSTIRNRVENLNQTSTHIALFLEYVPQNLYEWLPAQISKGGGIADSAIAFVDENLKTTNAYMNAHGLMHFDAHFNNILTDGKLLYFTDFGLALSLHFELTTAEIEFLKLHQHYDCAYASLNLLLCIFATIFEKDQWGIRLHEYITDKPGELSSATVSIIKQHTPIALTMDAFMEKLRKESKSTPYPATQLKKLFAQRQVNRA